MTPDDFNTSSFGKTYWIVKPGSWAHCPACGSTDAIDKRKDCPLCLGGELWASVRGGMMSYPMIKNQVNRYYYAVPCTLTSIERVESDSGSKILRVWVDLGGMGLKPKLLQVFDFRFLFEKEAAAQEMVTFLNYKAIGETLSMLPMDSVVGYFRKDKKKS